jgi:TIR domain
MRRKSSMAVLPPRIFLSHSSKDHAFCVRLVDDLRRILGDDDAVWYDARGGLHGGDAWWRKIEQELSARNVFIVVLSPDAVASAWVNDEIDIAWRRKNHPDPASRMRFIPVLYRSCTIRPGLESLQMVSFLSPKTYEAALQDILIALGLPSQPVNYQKTPPAKQKTRLTEEERRHKAAEAEQARLVEEERIRKAAVEQAKKIKKVQAHETQELANPVPSRGSVSATTESPDTPLKLPLQISPNKQKRAEYEKARWDMYKSRGEIATHVAIVDDKFFVDDTSAQRVIQNKEFISDARADLGAWALIADVMRQAHDPNSKTGQTFQAQMQNLHNILEETVKGQGKLRPQYKATAYERAKAAKELRLLHNEFDRLAIEALQTYHSSRNIQLGQAKQKTVSEMQEKLREVWEADHNTFVDIFLDRYKGERGTGFKSNVTRDFIQIALSRFRGEFFLFALLGGHLMERRTHLPGDDFPSPNRV